MKSVLMSIQPKWCELLANGKKTIEIRKTKPKIETPFKVYIYCSSIARVNLDEYTKIFRATNGRIDDWHGKVIGEFVCDSIVDCRDINMDCTCLTVPEWLQYTKGHKGNVWGWHISDLVIYDEPLDINDFVTEGDCTCEKCKECKYFDKGNGFNVEDDCRLPYEHNFKTVKPLFRPPQSWCYVEEGGER